MLRSARATHTNAEFFEKLVRVAEDRKVQTVPHVSVSTGRSTWVEPREMADLQTLTEQRS